MDQLVTIRRVTVIVEQSLEKRLLDEFLKLGAKGYTCMDCWGKGEHTVVVNPFKGVSLVRIELLVQHEVAERIIDYLHRDIFQHYAVTACVENVQVATDGRF